MVTQKLVGVGRFYPDVKGGGLEGAARGCENWTREAFALGSRAVGAAIGAGKTRRSRLSLLSTAPI